MVQLVIFDFDGTLFDTHESIEHCIKGTFHAFQPDQPADANQVRRLIGKGTGLYDTFNALQPEPDIYNEKQWEAKYRELYATEGQSLIKPYPGSRELLDRVLELGIPAAIVTNKGVTAVHTALENNGMAGLIPTDLIVGDKTPGTTRKPDTGSYTHVLAPNLERLHSLTIEDPSKIVVVGDTEADVTFAKNLGARSIWCKYGYGSELCAQLAPDHIVSSLSEVAGLLSDG